MQEKTRWFPRLENAEQEISNSFGIPKNTLIGWKKFQSDSSNYRGLTFDKMSLIVKLEENAKAKIKNLFSRDELKAVWGSLKSTMYVTDLIEMDKALSYQFADYCAYESLEASQFTDKDLKIFSKVVSDKLYSLIEFERYVLLEFIRSEDGENFIFHTVTDGVEFLND